MCELSVVVPVYKCTPCLVPLHERLTTALDGLVDSYEIILVDDCGGEDAWTAISGIAERDQRVKGIALSRNFGQHAAITAGLQEASGRHAVVMDCDLQEPPELVRQLVAKSAEGFDIVYTRRRRKTLSAARRVLSRLYFRLLTAMTGTRIEADYGTLSIISRKVIDSYLQFRERDRHYLHILKWLGYESTEIHYEQEERSIGRSSYTIRVLIRHALAGMFFQTTRLLRWVIYLGLVIASTGFLVAAYFIAARVRGMAAPGWTSLAVFTLGVGGVTIVSVGLVGLYVARIFDEVRQRPLFVVAEKVGGAPDAESVPVHPEVHRS